MQAWKNRGKDKGEEEPEQVEKLYWAYIEPKQPAPVPQPPRETLV